MALYDSLINKKHVVAQLKAAQDNAKAADDAAVKELRGAMGAGADEELSWTSPRWERCVASTASLNQDLVVLTEGRVQGLMAKARDVLAKGKYGEADQALEAAVMSSKVVLGEQSAVYFRALLMVIEIKSLLGRFEESNQLLTSLLQLWTDLKGPDHLEVAEVAAALAHVYVSQGLYDAAATLYAQVIEVVGHKLQYDPMAHHNTGAVRNVLYCQVLIGVAEVYTKQGHFADAVASSSSQAVHGQRGCCTSPDDRLLYLLRSLASGGGTAGSSTALLPRELDRASRYIPRPPRGCEVHALAGARLVEQGGRRACLYRGKPVIRLKTLPDDHPDVLPPSKRRAPCLPSSASTRTPW